MPGYAYRIFAKCQIAQTDSPEMFGSGQVAINNHIQWQCLQLLYLLQVNSAQENCQKVPFSLWYRFWAQADAPVARKTVVLSSVLAGFSRDIMSRVPRKKCNLRCNLHYLHRANLDFVNYLITCTLRSFFRNTRMNYENSAISVTWMRDRRYYLKY